MLSNDPRTWSTALPTLPGLYQFWCPAFKGHREMVLVERRGDVLWGRMNGEWQPLADWHSSQHAPRWKAARKLPREKQAAALKELGRDYTAFVESAEAHDFHDARIHEVLSKAEERASAKHGWQKVTHRTPLDELLNKEAGETAEEHKERMASFLGTLGYFFADGAHPGVVMRRVYAIAKALKPEYVLWMSMKEIGLMFGESRAAQSWRISKIFNGYIAAAGKKNGSVGTAQVKAHCQKTASHTEKLRKAAMGNSSRKGTGKKNLPQRKKIKPKTKN